MLGCSCVTILPLRRGRLNDSAFDDLPPRFLVIPAAPIFQFAQRVCYHTFEFVIFYTNMAGLCKVGVGGGARLPPAARSAHRHFGAKRLSFVELSQPNQPLRLCLARRQLGQAPGARTISEMPLLSKSPIANFTPPLKFLE